MAEKDISFLMSELNLYPTQQQNALIQPLKEDDAHKPNTQTRRRRRPGPQKVCDNYTSPQQNRTPTRRTGQDRLATRSNSSAKMPEPSSPTNANFDSAPEVGAPSSSAEAIAANDDSSSKVRPAHVYIVQIMRPSEEVEGVYCSSEKANNRAMIYLNTKHGINANEISEKRGRFGQAIAATKAVKRMWMHTGTLEILTCGGTPWIRVLKKPLYSCHVISGEDHVYLSLDRSDGLFVIGAYQSQDEAWEGCKKYWTDLSVCASTFELKDSHEKGRAQATISGRIHRWVLKHCKLL
ncbi:hypothetical protein N7471_010621 [Penicillium samsonianum]|uniref:uncharacterized protein n=1 Tax=Penicillium samsonianum TaxID=1882272 RepID=UPI0025484C0E|nr:uncharacterized protein N7471_010621 [Penicillium samsonianum]KAJ6126128.1 hypothetical protein N7471_010621 [Penicillium samsonianum]